MAVVVYVPSRLGEGYFTDLPAPTAADDAKAITYDHGTGAFVYAAAGGGGTPGGLTTQVQYNNAGSFAGDAGMTYDAANDRLTVAGGLVAPSMRPASDSTPALQWQDAAGTGFVFGDTTNGRVGVGETPTDGKFTVLTDSSIAPLTTTIQSADAFSSGIYVRKRGTAAGATNAVLNGSELGYHSFYGWNGIAYGRAAYVIVKATQNFSSGQHGSSYSIATTANAASGPTIRLTIDNTGYVAIGTHTPTAVLDLAAGTTARAPLRIRAGTAPTTPNAGDIWDDDALVAYQINATTNAVVNSLKLRRGSSGTPAAGFGLGIAARLESSTTEDQDAGRLTWEWVTATHASRASRGKLTAYYTSTEQTAMTWDGDTGGLKLGFYGVTPVARQVLATGAGASVDNVIQALQNLGLVKQS